MHYSRATTRSLLFRGNGQDYNPFFGPDTNVVTLGNPSYRWGQIYSMSSTISTSDRSAKLDIHYIDQQYAPKMRMATASSEPGGFTTDDIISFVSKLNPCTFVYKDESEEPRYQSIQEALSTNNTEMVQLGLIADDIKDEPLFNYIGATMEYDKIIEPEEKDEEGNVIKEAVTKKAVTLGLKSIPLAVAALTACKNLLERVEQLENKIQ